MSSAIRGRRRSGVEGKAGCNGPSCDAKIVSGAHAVAVDLLPAIHKDPVDRLLVAQAQVEGLTLLTVDPVVGRYPGPIRLL